MIATELWEALCRIRIPGEARQVLDVVIRKTYGFKKKTDVIAISQIMKATGLKRGHVVRGRDKLLSMNMIIIVKRSEKGSNDKLTYSFQKDYDLWRGVPKKVRGTKGVPKKVAKRSHMGTTIDTLTKETREEAPSSGQLDLNDKKKLKERKPVKKPLGDHQEAMAFFCGEYKKYQRQDYLVSGGKDGKAMKTLLNHYGLEKLKKITTIFFLTTDPWFEQTGRSITIMAQQANKLAVELSNAQL